MRLTANQRKVLIGTLLGDGHLERNGKYVRLRIDHSMQQRRYVEWKYRHLRSLTVSGCRKVVVHDKRTKRAYYHFVFDTISTRLLIPYKNIFYKSSKKIVPLEIKKMLKDSLTLAVWFMDDGYRRKDCGALHINTQAYSLVEQRLLQETLMDNFGLRTRVHWAAGRPKLYIPSAESGKFLRLVAPFIIPSMKYKIGSLTP